MGVKVVPTCFQLSHPIIPHTTHSARNALFCRYVGKVELLRTRSYDPPLRLKTRSVTRACTASFDGCSDGDFSKKIRELALRFQLRDDWDRYESNPMRNNFEENNVFEENESDFASIERKAKSVEIPLSLRIIKRKLKWEEGFKEVGESAYCSVKKAFSSMVFIIRELHSYSLQMRELLFTQDLQGILERVQKEMNASFVWLFQQVFSHTPTLMVYVMILLANFTVHSMASNAAIAATYPVEMESISVAENLDRGNPCFDSSSVKSFSVNKYSSIGGNNGGGSKIRPVASGMDGDGWYGPSDRFRTIVPDGAHSLSSFGTTREADNISRQEEEESSLWNSILDEAEDESLDRETRQAMVSPIAAKIEADEYADYHRTELVYETGLAQDPNNPLLLANYAQFLYLVAHDYDRAEEYFKKAIKVEPPDAEAYSKYASFLWRARNDLWAAEETFLEAISADPTNSYYAANYAHFLWNTGGEDTCFPLSDSQEL